MTDTPLDKLRHLPVPRPDAAARDAALAAARGAFAKSQSEIEIETEPKESEPSPRPMPATPQARRPRMHWKFDYRIAATIAVMAIGVPLAWQLTGDQFHPSERARSTATKIAVPAPSAAGGEASSANKVPTKTVDRDAPQVPPTSSPVPGIPGIVSDSVNPPAGMGKAVEANSRGPEQDSRSADAKAKSEALSLGRRGELAATANRKGDRSNLGVVADGAGAGVHGQPGPDSGKGRGLHDKAPEPKAVTASPAAKPTELAYSHERRALMESVATRQQGIADEYKKLHDVAPGKRAGLVDPAPYLPQVVVGRDRFPEAPVNPVKRVAEEPVSTFSVDVDTASYAIVRRALNAGRLPPRNGVRIEEMINYFPYAYPLPESQTQPFLPTVTVVPSPWNPGRQLVHVAIKGYALSAAERPRANLVFLIDTSGSMGPEDRLPLVRNALRMLVGQLRPEDSIGIVTYAGNASALLQPTKLTEKAKILAAIERLSAGGSTAGAAGLQQAYAMAEAGFEKSAVNRIVLATDGDFNVGMTDRGELQSFIERKRETGVYLSILGVGIGNHNDRLMQTLAQAGNGVAAHIDTLAEARKVLVEEASSTLFPIARDVKIQVEFNPAVVAEYRLVGYETRLLKREDFNNDKVDAGDVGAGHAVTAIYEITPVGAAVATDPLRYGPAPVKAEERVAQSAPARTGELGFLKLRYKLPKEDTSRLIEIAIGQGLVKSSLGTASDDVRFAIAVAGFGELLKGSAHTGRLTFDDVIALASSARGDDAFGYRAEFVNLVRLAKTAAP